MGSKRERRTSNVERRTPNVESGGREREGRRGEDAAASLDAIHIRDLRLRCIVGVYEQERREKQDVVLQITLYADLRKAGRSDDLADTVDYKSAKKAVVALVEASSFKLVEALAEAVAETCLAQAGVQAVRVLVEKPGALRFARTVGVEIRRERRSNIE